MHSEMADNIMTVTINRPESRNSLDMAACKPGRDAAITHACLTASQCQRAVPVSERRPPVAATTITKLTSRALLYPQTLS